MKFILNKDVFTIEDAETVNSGSVNYYEAEVEYDESWKNLAIKAVLLESEEGTAKQIAVINNKLFLDREEFGSFKVGFIGYTIENEQKIYQISTNLQSIFIQKGAGSIEVVEGDIPTLTEWEIYIAQLQNFINDVNRLDIDAVEDNGGAIISITKTDGTTKQVKVEKGDKGDAGSIKIIPVSEFPTENIDESAIYVIPNENPTSEDDKYKEYIYVNGDWEPFGGGVLNVDLADYVKFTDYATGSKAGIIKTFPDYGLKTNTNGVLEVSCATVDEILKKTQKYKPIVPLYLDSAVGSVKASEAQSGTAKMWTSTNEDGEVGLNISTEV